MKSGPAIFLKSVKAICPHLTDLELSQFGSTLTEKEFNKKDFFIPSCKIQKAIGFITKGLVRSFFIDQNGNEITVGFYSEGDYATIILLSFPKSQACIPSNA